MYRHSQIMVRLVVAILLVFVSMESSAQTRKGERLVNEGRYEEAIKPLKRAFDNGGDRRAGNLLITAYYMLQQYQDALDIADIMNLERTLDEEEMILYADVLIANNDFSTAYLNLTRMLSGGGANVQGMKWLNKTGNLLEWDSVSSGNTMHELQGLNTIYNEYAPYITEDGIMYIADHLTVQVLYPSAFTNQSLHLLFQSSMNANDKFGKAKMVMKGREYYYHDGPIEKFPDREKYAVSLREIEGLLYDLKMNIFFTDLSGSEESLIPFKYNGNYNTGHPTLTEDGTKMYFASDRPGGYGQFDIWYSELIGDEWTLPVNAGPLINSPANELYPKIRNHRLFFSSDRRDIGYGGLDLYYVSLLSKHDQPYNLRAPINSPYDDFAVDFVDVKTGYFSSNRRSGFGGDDIYRMHFQPETKKLDTLILALEDKKGMRKTIRIYDSVGNEMVGIDNADQTLTMSNLFTRELYTVETDSLFDQSLTLVAYNSSGRKMQEFTSDQSSFQIEFLEQDEFTMRQEENVDESELFDLLGSVITEEEEDFDQVFVILKDEEGKMLDETKTDSTGKFSMKGLSWDESYNISTKGTKGDVEIDVLGQSGAPITTLVKTPGKNSFAYTRMRPEADWMMTTEVTLPAVFGIIPGTEISTEAKPGLYSIGDSLIRKCSVDDDGFIELGSLTTGHAYELVFDNKVFESNNRLVILGGSGDTTQTVRPDGESSFIFEFMAPGKLKPDTHGPDLSEENMTSEPIAEETHETSMDNLTGSASKLKPDEKLKLYDSRMQLLSETYAAEGGDFKFSEVEADSVYYVEADMDESFELISTYHGFEKSAKKQSQGLWIIDYTPSNEAEKIISLPNIYYRFDTYTLSSESTVSLDNLYGFLKQNPNQKIKVLSHTDSRGSKSYNNNLSELRAREVVRYLVRRGIEPERLDYEGRGESKPVNECVDGVRCSNEKHAENRRTEFVLIKN